jgi:hypothetical protein
MNQDPRARTLTFLSSALIALQGVAAANGDVSARVDANGDLWVIADDADNRVRLYADYEDSYTVAGLDAATTVNGQASVTLVAQGARLVVILGGGNNEVWLNADHGSPHVRAFRELVVVGGSGKDRLLLVGPVPNGTVDLGGGNDFVSVSESAGGWRANVFLGEGNDVLTANEVVYLDGLIDFGAGDDRLEASDVNGRVLMGAGDDRVSMSEASLDLELDTGTGDDVLELELWSGRLALTAGDGRDRVRITGDPASLWSRPIDSLSIDLGPGEDRLELGAIELGAAALDGGPGADAYLDHGGIVFVAGPPELRSFEAREGFSGRTRVTGRVLAEGMPVPGAVVLLPELERSTTTDSAGAFRFEAVPDEARTIELVIGATTSDRARSGARQVELTPFETTDAGAIALARHLVNVLVIGTTADGTDLGAFMEANLLALGWRPAEVTTLDRPPENLAPYGVVWHVGGILPADARPALVDFVRAGRGLYLSGGGGAQAVTVEALVNELVRGGGIEVGVRGTATTQDYAFNPDAAGGVTTRPNRLTRFHRSTFTRFLTGLAPRNVLLRMTSSGDVPGAVWDGFDLVGGRGSVALVTDNSWIRPRESLEVLENFLAFLTREPGVPATSR